jgi:hypothetical protein
VDKENVTYLRLSPRTKCFVRLAARNAGMGFAEFLESLLVEYLDFATVTENGEEKSLAKVMDELWSEHPADRLALIGSRFPEALTERERVLFQRIICMSARYWLVPLTGEPLPVNSKTFNFRLFREELSLFDDYTRDEMLVEANDMARQKEFAANWPKPQHPLPLSIAKGGNKR